MSKARAIKMARNKDISKMNKRQKDNFRKLSCEGKVAHASLLSAQYCFDEYRGDRRNLEIYHCVFCKKYHLGHNKKD